MKVIRLFHGAIRHTGPIPHALADACGYLDGMSDKPRNFLWSMFSVGVLRVQLQQLHIDPSFRRFGQDALGWPNGCYSADAVLQLSNGLYAPIIRRERPSFAPVVPIAAEIGCTVTLRLERVAPTRSFGF